LTFDNGAALCPLIPVEIKKGRNDDKEKRGEGLNKGKTETRKERQD